jgi:putative ABC transport system permease protein
MNSLWNDLRFAVRILAKSPGFTAITLLALALGIGANSAMFTVVNAVLLRPLPFHSADRLAMAWEQSPGAGKPNVVNPQNFKDWEARNRSFEKMAAYIDSTSNIGGGSRPEQVYGGIVTLQFFSLLGVQPVLGRDFIAEEDVPGHEDAVLLSYGLWQRRYGGDLGIVGKKIELNGLPARIVGVIPADFRFPGMKAEIWDLYSIRTNAQRQGRFLSVVGRLKPGVSLSQAQSDLQKIAAQLATEHPEFDRKWGATVVDLREQFTGALRTPLLVLLGAVTLVLFIACANVANLMLMRSAVRRRELAVRASLGASQWRIARQLLMESGVLGLTGGCLGLVLAVWAKDLLLGIMPESMSVAKVNVVTVDRNVFLFTLAVSVLTSVLFGLAPVSRMGRLDILTTLKEGVRSVGHGVGGNRMRAVLATGEIALALMLLIGAGLLLRSFARLEQVPPGFQPDRLLTLHVELRGPRYRDPVKRASALEEILTRVRAVPGVKSVASIQWPPFGPVLPATGFWVDGRPVPKPGEQPVTGVSVVSEDYFSTMGIPLISGRVLDQRDRANAPLVTVISQSLAKQFFPNQDPLRQRLFVQWGRDVPYQIVGVVGDVKHRGLDLDAMPTVFFADAQEPAGGGTLVVRTGLDPMLAVHPIENAIHQYDPEQVVAAARPMGELMSQSVARPRFQSVLLGCFAGLALLLASIGIFGVMSYSVTQRTGEIGVRMALGAQRGQIVRMIARQGALLAGAGAAAGLLGALAFSRLLKSLLFDLSPTDPATFVIVPAVLFTIALIAATIPAWPATRVDPIVALRYE